MKNKNPIVAEGPCAVCGETVKLFKQDEDSYLAAPHRGLVHFQCIDKIKPS